MTNQPTLFDRRPSEPTSSEPAPRGMTILAAAKYLGQSRWTVQRLIRKGEIADFYIGASHMVDRASVDAFIERQKLARQAQDGG